MRFFLCWFLAISAILTQVQGNEEVAAVYAVGAVLGFMLLDIRDKLK